METTTIKLQDSAITLPAEVRGVQKRFLFTSNTNLAANGVLISSVFDTSAAKSISISISADKSGTVYVQESEDQSVWYNTYSSSVSAYTTTTISGTSYNSTSVFTTNITAKYVRVVYVNGATTQTKFLISSYTVSN